MNALIEVTLGLEEVYASRHSKSFLVHASLLCIFSSKTFLCMLFSDLAESKQFLSSWFRFSFLFYLSLFDCVFLISFILHSSHYSHLVFLFVPFAYDIARSSRNSSWTRLHIHPHLMLPYNITYSDYSIYTNSLYITSLTRHPLLAKRDIIYIPPPSALSSLHELHVSISPSFTSGLPYRCSYFGPLVVVLIIIHHSYIFREWTNPSFTSTTYTHYTSHIPSIVSTYTLLYMYIYYLTAGDRRVNKKPNSH